MKFLRVENAIIKIEDIRTITIESHPDGFQYSKFYDIKAYLVNDFVVECFTEMSKANADEKLKEIYRSLCESGE